jgi:YD repeat-containing protein
MTTYTFDALNRVTVTTNPSGKTQTVSYDNAGNVFSQTNEANQTTTFTYDAVNRQTSKTDALDGVTAYGYDTVGNLLTLTEPGNMVTTYIHDAANRVTSKTVPNGTTQYAYDNANNLVTLTTNSGARRAYVYNNDNLATSETRYDAQNNVLVTFTYVYDETHNRTSETETRPNQSPLTTTYGYDDLNRNTSITDPYGATTGYTFDAAGNLITQTDPAGFSTSITPNAANLPKTIVHRDENQNIVATTTNTFNAANELDSWTTTDPLNNLTLNNDLNYNGNGYIDQANVSHQGQLGAPALTSSAQYSDNNLLGAWTQ